MLLFVIKCDKRWMEIRVPVIYCKFKNKKWKLITLLSNSYQEVWLGWHALQIKLEKVIGSALIATISTSPSEKNVIDARLKPDNKISQLLFLSLTMRRIIYLRNSIILTRNARIKLVMPIHQPTRNLLPLLSETTKLLKKCRRSFQVCHHLSKNTMRERQLL